MASLPGLLRQGRLVYGTLLWLPLTTCPFYLAIMFCKSLVAYVTSGIYLVRRLLNPGGAAACPHLLTFSLCIVSNHAVVIMKSNRLYSLTGG
eukprot:7652221-Heterocapsa_arctica.AAC.1